jgi:hypothetical protein
MKSLWSDPEAAQFGGELDQRVYTSRLLGKGASLVFARWRGCVGHFSPRQPPRKSLSMAGMNESSEFERK